LFSGIFPALLTPLTSDARVDTAALGELIQFVLSHGVDGLYLCGSTGEGLLLTEQERQQVTETAIRQVAGRVPVIVHVGAISTASAERLAHHARAAGADAVAAVPPFYYAVGRQGIEAHYRRIAQAGGLPLYFYNIPAATQVSAGAELVRALFEDGVIRGLKYTSYDQLNLREIIETCGPELNVFSGPDEMVLPFLTMGVHGAIGTTYNCLPQTVVALYAAWRAGDMDKAQRLQYQIDRFILVLRQFSIVPAVKAVMEMLGVDCGPPCAPLMPLTGQERERLAHELQQIGFFDSVTEGRP